jgi:XTP/dITP diphosphohydrolase
MMDSNKIYFITTNGFKKEEALSAFRGSGIPIDVVQLEIQEIMHLDLGVIVKDKLLKAYKEFGLPCAVEHGALHIDSLNRLPGGISKVVWDTIQGKICNLILPSEERGATAKSLVGYCDGKKMYFFEGETRGTISDKARGDRAFQWDPIFIPEGCEKTYSELGFPGKEEYSQATKAWQKLINFLKQTN